MVALQNRLKGDSTDGANRKLLHGEDWRMNMMEGFVTQFILCASMLEFLGDQRV